MSILGVMDKNVFWYSDNHGRIFWHVPIYFVHGCLNGAKFFSRVLEFKREYLGNGARYELTDRAVGSALKTWQGIVLFSKTIKQVFYEQFAFKDTRSNSGNLRNKNLYISFSMR